MMRALINRRLASAERSLGASMDYLRFMMRASPRGFRRFATVLPLSGYRRVVPPDAYHVARLVATHDEHCTGCLQIEIVLARESGVGDDVIDAALDGRVELLTDPVRDAYQFAHAVVRATGDESLWRERVRGHFGDEGLVELALGIATARLFPVTRRALGFDTRVLANADV
jgi:alkylhydroperoxidase family enzyme